MRITRFVLLALLAMPSVNFAQIKFDKPVIPPGMGYPKSMVTGDFDGNGTTDVIVNSTPTSSLKAFYSLDAGDHLEKDLELPDDWWSGAGFMMAGDVNEDGKDDMLVCQRSSSLLHVFLSTGKDFEAHSMSLDAFSVNRKGVVIDFDNDGHLDVVLAADDLNIQVLKGDGAGSFTSTMLSVDPNIDDFFDFHVVDLNNDDKYDFVVVTDVVTTFLKSQSSGYTKATKDLKGSIKQWNDEPRSSVIADFNGDQTPDLIAINLFNDNGSYNSVLSFFSNSGGSFENESLLPSPSNSMCSIDHADFNIDGREDLVIGTRDDENSVKVLRNIGDAHFQDKSPQRPEWRSGQDIRFIDVDGTGSLEIVDLTGNRILDWFKWNGTTWSGSDSLIFGGACTVAAIYDLDNDGFKDIIGAAVSGPAVEIWYGKGKLQYEKPVFIPVVGTLWSVAVADFNNDGLGDIIYDAGPTGDSNPWDGLSIMLATTPRMFAAKQSFGDDYTQTSMLVTEDFDNDGDIDLADQNAVHLNNGSGQFTSTFHDGPSSYGISNGDAGYLDDDEYLDLAVSSEEGTYYFINDGEGHFIGADIEVSDNFEYIRLADLDNDGRSEVVGAYNKYGTTNVSHIIVLKVDDELNFNEIQHIIPTPSNSSVLDVDVADLDYDGLPDIVTGFRDINEYEYGVAVYQQLSTGGFSDTNAFVEQPNVPGVYLQQSYALYLEDLDNDSRLDALNVFLDDVTLAIYPNITINVSEPTVASSSLEVVPLGDKATITLHKGNGQGRIILVRKATDGEPTLEDDIFYRADATFGNGDKVNNNFVVMKGSDESVTVNGLAGGTDYVVTVFEYRTNGIDIINYMSTGISTVFSTRKAQTITFANTDDLVFGNADITVSATASSGLDVTLEIIKGSGVIEGNQFVPTEPGKITLRARQTGNEEFAPVVTDVTFCFIPPQPTISVTGGDIFTLTSSSEANNKWYVGDQLMTAGSNGTYHPSKDGKYVVAVDLDGCANYSEPTDFIIVGPTGLSTNIEVSSVTLTGAAFSVEPGNGHGRMAVVRKGSDNLTNPVNGTFYTAGNTLGSGTVAAGNNVDQFSITGLDPGTNYVVTIFEWYTNNADVINYSNVGAEGSFKTLSVQTINFANTGNNVFGAANSTVTVTASSGLPVEVTLVSGNGTVQGNTFTPTSPGKVTLHASQGGNSEFGATETEITFCINPPIPVISLSSDLIPMLTSSSDENNTWYLNGVEIEGAADKSYTPAEDGTYKVVVTIDGCSSFSEATQNIITAVEDEMIKGFSLSPNPATSLVTIVVPSGLRSEPVLYNGVGVSFSVPISTGERSIQLHTSELQPGLYVVRLQNVSLKFIKQ